MMVGRVPELARLRTLLDWSAATNRGWRAPALSVVVQGAPGIGKTFLIEHALNDATDAGLLAGVQTVRACGFRSEVHLPYAGLVELLGPLLEQIGFLPAAQRDALERALALGPVDCDASAYPESNGERLTVALAIRSLLVGGGIGGASRVLAVIDDAQWLDTESLECILFAARRVGVNCRILLAARDDEISSPFHGIEVLRVGPLTDVESDELVRRRSPLLGQRQRSAVTKASEGFPLALVQYADAADSPGSWTGASGIMLKGGAPNELFGSRIESLAETARQSLLIAASSGSEESSTIIEACQSEGLDVSGLLDAEQRGLIHLAGNRVHFSHPLLRSAVYARATPAERRHAHGVLADVTYGTERAWHLAAASVLPNDRAADALDAAGRDAVFRRASSAATDAFARSAELTPHGGPRLERLSRAVQAAGIAGRLDEAVGMARSLLGSSDIPRERGMALTALATAVAYGSQAVDLRDLEEQIDTIRQPSPIHAATAYTWLAFAWMNRFEFSAAQRILDSARDTIGFPLESAARYVLAAQGDRAGARATPTTGPTNPLTKGGHLLVAYWLEDYDQAEQLLDDEARSGRSREAPQHCLLRGSINAHRGRWTEAQAQLSDAAELALMSGEVLVRGQAIAAMARISAARGDDATARAALTKLCALVRTSPDLTVVYSAFAALGHLELTTGDAVAAVAALRISEGIAARSGMNDPAHVPWSIDLIEASIRLGDREAARRATEDLAGRVELSGSMSGAALLAYANAMLSPLCDDSLFLTALRYNEQAPRPFHEARMRLTWGARLHRERRRADARVQLRAAKVGFDALGASPWSTRAEAELAAAGGVPNRGSRSSVLTPQELAVARSAAAGSTVKEIGIALFLSPKTVDGHLASVYRKLAVRSRVALADALRSAGTFGAQGRQPLGPDFSNVENGQTAPRG